MNANFCTIRRICQNRRHRGIKPAPGCSEETGWRKQGETRNSRQNNCYSNIIQENSLRTFLSDCKKQGFRPGSAFIACLLAMSIFMTLGLGLLLNSRLFLQAHGFRKLSRLSSYAAENGVKQSLNRILEKAQETSSETEINEEIYLALRKSIEAGKTEVVGPLLEAGSVNESEDFSGFSWQTGTTAVLTDLYTDEFYFRATFGLNIESTGRVQGFSGAGFEEVKAELVLLAGHLPLNLVPAVVEKTGISEKEIHKIKLKELQPGVAPVSTVKRTSGKFIPEDALPLLARALKILRPERIPNWLLRQALGLEPGNDPVPEGIYLVEDSLGPGGLYVQGDLDRLLFGIDRGFQSIQLEQGEARWLLRFNPSTATTHFFSPEGRREFAELPIPLVMVNGEVSELRTGRPGKDGFLTPAEDESTPAFLNMVRITVVCSGKITIASSLFSEGLDWKNGLPYLRSKQSELIIWSTGKDFQTAETVMGGIEIQEAPGKKITIEASLVAGGSGLTVSAETGEAEIIGSLAAKSFSTGGREVSIYHRPPEPSQNSAPDLQVYSETPLFHLSHLRILQWRSLR